MSSTLPNYVNALLSNPSSQISQDGINLTKKQPPTAASYARSTASSYTLPLSAPAVVLPRPPIQSLTPIISIPSGYQPTVRLQVGLVIAAVLQATLILSGQRTGGRTQNIDIGTPVYTGNVATQLFSGIRASVSTTAPQYGVTTGVGQIASGMAVMSNAAVGAGRASMVARYGTTVLDQTQYAEFSSVTLDSFNTQFDNQPDVQTTAASTSLRNTTLTARALPPSTSNGNQIQQHQVSVHAASASQNDPAVDVINPNPYTYKVYLVSTMNSGDMFVFGVQPSIQVTESAEYSTFSPLHAPGQILSFKNSPGRTFNISEFKLISRNSVEASANLTNLHVLRGWTKPYFGRSQIQTPTQTEVVDHSMDTSAGINARANARMARQGGVASVIADNAAAAAEVARLNRDHPQPYATPPTAVIASGTIQTSSDAINQTISPNAQLPAITAASSRARVVADANYENPVVSRVGSGSSSASFAMHDPRRLDLSNGTAGSGRGGQGGPTAAELAAQTTPITPTAESAQSTGPEVIKSTLGAPPEILYLYGYSADGSAAVDGPQNLRRIPVVIESLVFNYPNDVDYIPTLDGVPFPTVMNISIGLKETKSPYEIEQFSLADYKLGKLIGW